MSTRDENGDDPLERLIQAHVEADHLLTVEQVRPMVDDHNQMKRDQMMIIDELYGESRPTAADPYRRRGGMVAVLVAIRDDVAYLKEAAENGSTRTRRKWGIGEWSVAGAFIVLCGSISAAIIAAVFGG